MTAHTATLDHPTAEVLAAASIDALLVPEESARLEGHVRGCSACRSRLAGFEADARSLRGLDLGDAPARTRARVAVAASTALDRRGPLGLGRGTTLAAAAAFLLVALAASLLGGLGGRPDRPTESGPTADGGGGRPIVFKTNVVMLAAGELWVDAAGRRFIASGQVNVSSDPGNPTYRTLELSWFEHGAPMRINLYFAGDGQSWWVDEIRTYDGAAQGDWVSAKGRFFESTVGSPWSGSLDIALTDVNGAGGMPVALHLANALIAVNPFDGVNEPLGGGIALREGQKLFESGAPLHCAGIGQMHPKDAESVLLALGYRLSSRYITNVRGNESYWDIRAEAPDAGYILVDTFGTMVGTEGELIIPVMAPAEPGAHLKPAPDDCPA